MTKTKPKKRLHLLVLIALVLIPTAVVVGIIVYFNNRTVEPVARPCLLPSAVEGHPKFTEASALQDLRDYAAEVPNAETIVDEVDVICVLALNPNNSDEFIMHYFEDDDGFADFVPYALATRHWRTMGGRDSLTGSPDVGQRYAVSTLMTVLPDGKVQPIYEQVSTTRWAEDKNPVSHPGATVTQVQFGNDKALKLSDAFNNVPGRYIEGTSSFRLNAVTGTFEDLRREALTPTGSDEDKSSGHPKPPAVTTTTTKPKGTTPATTTTTKPSRTTTTTTTTRASRTR